MKFLVFLLTLALIIEGSVTTIPLSFAILLALLLTISKQLIFYLAFIVGMFLDLFNLRPIGLSSIYFLLFFFAVLLYEHKFEIKTPSFILISSFLGSLGFLGLTGVTNLIVFQAATVSIVSLVLFRIYESKDALNARKARVQVPYLS